MIYDYILYIAFINDSLEIYEFEGHHNWDDTFSVLYMRTENYIKKRTPAHSI